jgi:DNA-binding GntR family transcriptional regulator
MGDLSFLLNRAPSLTEAAIDRLAAAIVSGHFKAGQRLIENELSEMLGISRAPLREALRALAKEGLVEIRRSRGAVVASPTADDIEHLVVFRALVEGAAARFVAFRRDRDVLKRLGAIFASMEHAHRRNDGQTFLQHVWEFHGSLCAESQNPFLLQSWNIAGNLTRLYLQRAVPTINFEAVLANNRAILHALESESPAKAEALVRSLIIRLAYQLIEREIPASIREYVTRPLAAAAPARKRSPRKA